MDKTKLRSNLTFHKKQVLGNYCKYFEQILNFLKCYMVIGQGVVFIDWI